MTIFAAGRIGLFRTRVTAPVPGARPAWSSTGTKQENDNISAGPFLPTWPATITAGDLGLLIATVQNSPGGCDLGLTAGAVTDGWVQLAKIIKAAAGADADKTLALLVAYKIAAGTEDGAAMVGGWDKTSGVNTADVCMSHILRFTAANGFAATPYEDAGTGEFTGTTYNAPTVTPSGANRLAVAIAAAHLSSAAGFDAFTGASGGTWVERFDVSTILATDAHHHLQTADIDSAISGGSDTVTSLTYLTVKFALVPANI